jgi:pyrroloquinoline quinone biosynthesis protein E
MSVMIKVRAEEKALLVWDSKYARTAYISGEELNALARWTYGMPGRFSDRIQKLGIICDGDLPEIKEAIAAAANKQAPPNSFCAPESLHIELTSRCPLNCPQCYKTHDETDLSYELLCDVIRQAGEMKAFQIALGGGEPLVYPHLASAISEIKKRGMAASVTTSGFSLDRDMLGRLIGSGLNHIQISLNGSCEDIHSRSRDGFEYAVNALELLKEAKISFGVNWVARSDNIDDLPTLIETSKSYRVCNINILRYKPSPNEKYADVCLSAEKLLQLKGVIRNTKGISIKTDSAFSNLLCHINKRISFFSGCGAGRRFLALDSTGYYRPCSHMSMKEKSGSLYEVWHNSGNLSMFRSIGERILRPCNTCGFLDGCYGCRSVIVNLGNDFYAGDKDCVFYCRGEQK